MSFLRVLVCLRITASRSSAVAPKPRCYYRCDAGYFKILPCETPGDINSLTVQLMSKHRSSCLKLAECPCSAIVLVNMTHDMPVDFCTNPSTWPKLDAPMSYRIASDIIDFTLLLYLMRVQRLSQILSHMCHLLV